jgi:integrase
LEVWFDEHELFGPEDITNKLAKDYPDWRIRVDEDLMKPCKWNTALTELRVLSTALGEAVTRGFIVANPCYRLGLKRRDTAKKPEITPDDQVKIEAALETAPAWMLHSWTIAMAQGFRLSETAVPIFNVDFTPRPGLANGSLWVRGKGDKIHVAPMHPAVRALALEAKEEGRTNLVKFPKSPAKEWWKFFRRLKLKMSFHSTRVTVVTRLARGGHTKAQTMAYVGHASETVHDVYTRLGAADVAHLGASLQVGGSQSGKSSDSHPATAEPTPRSSDRQA